MQSKSFKLNVKSLLPLGIVLIITIMLTTMSFGFINMRTISKEMISSTESNSVIEGLLRTMTESSLNRAILLLEMIQSNDIFRQDELYIEINTLATNFTVAREKLIQQDLDSQQLALLVSQSTLAKINVPLEHEIYDYLRQEKFEQAQSIFYENTVENRYKNIRILEEMSKNQYQNSQKSHSELKQIHESEVKNISLSGLASLLVSIFLTLMIVRSQNKSNSKLSKMAVTDTLTSLPNRFSLIQHIEQTLSSENKKMFCVIFLDIDYFKSINDNFGHEIGDEILKQFSNKISDSIFPGDILSRFGGDEFVVLLKNVNTLEQAKSTISEISKSLDTSFTIDNNEIYVSSSIGVSIYSPDSGIVNYKKLLKQADSAMYTAKESGRNCFQFFSKESHDKIQREYSISQALNSIIKNENKDNKLTLKYQPILNISDNNFNECEALLRWTTDKDEKIPTYEFISIANKKSDLIEKINSIVIKEICKQQSEWQKKQCHNIRINVNLSGNKTYFSHLLEEFEESINKYKLSPSQFGIDLNEKTIIEATKETIIILTKLRKQGMKISIDDFGTGYSSLSYLKKLPISTIKIDKSFISGLANISDDQELVKTIITVGHTLNLDIVAEGVETSEQLDFLLDHNCDYAQGYYFHNPLNHAKLTDLHHVSRVQQSKQNCLNRSTMLAIN